LQATHAIAAPVIAGSELCASRLGFRSGQFCRALVVPGAARCVGHQQAERTIARLAEKLRHLSSTPLTLENSLRRACRWWLKNKVRNIAPSARSAILASGPCVYCGDPETVEVDHIIPVARGGLSVWWNLAPACFRCNRDKADATVNEWCAARIAAGRFWPPLPLGEFRERMVAEALDAVEPEAFISDLHAAAASLITEPAVAPFEGDPRWLLARDAWTAVTSGLGDRDEWLRRHAAVELMFRIESTVEEAAS
jgi:5-methylcytosine-specific restriction endonuclease McrA